MSPQSQDTSMQMLESLALAGMGKPTRVVEPCEIVRQITANDLPLLAQEAREHNWTKDDSPTRMLQTLRSGHHQLAQLLAADVAVAEASLITGRSPDGIYALRNDPAFKELMAYYVQQQEGRDFDAYKRLVVLGGTAMEILQERLEDDPEKFTNNELRQLVESSMDRSAAPAKGDPRMASGKSSGLNVNINFVPARPTGPVVEVEATEVKLIEEKSDA